MGLLKWPFEHGGLFPFAALGAFMCWLRLRYGSNWANTFEYFIKEILGGQVIILFLAAVFSSVFGALLALAVVQPQTPPQAAAAGLAWTGLVGVGRPTKRSPRDKKGDG